MIKSGSVSKKAGRYSVSALVDEPEKQKESLNDSGIGIDLGVKEFAALSNGKTYGNINKTAETRKIEKQFKREQRRLSRKYED